MKHQQFFLKQVFLYFSPFAPFTYMSYYTIKGKINHPIFQSRIGNK